MLHFNLLILLAVIGGEIASIILEISHIYNLFKLKSYFLHKKEVIAGEGGHSLGVKSILDRGLASAAILSSVLSMCV